MVRLLQFILSDKDTMHTNALEVPVPLGFDTLNLIEPICRALREEQYETPTPIQEQAIPHLLQGLDLLGCAQTGTGKTAAFALPILQRLAENRQAPGPKGVRALILTPTRELALQIETSLHVYGRHLKFHFASVFGGVRPNLQIRALSRGVDILVATPGRLLDLFNQGCLRMDKIDVLVLDEADRMLDMGFLPDVNKIVSAIPKNRQTMLFSATLPNEIVQLTQKYLKNPVTVSVSPQSSTVEKIEQRVFFVERENKGALLEVVLQDATVERALVFTRTKHGANRIARKLNKSRIHTEALHGNKSQAARVQALNKFRSGEVRVLVATDVASRGLDVDGITHVINFELPKEAESYVHRIGRTARAGAAGMAFSFCDEGERGYLSQIERVIKRDVEVHIDHPYHSHAIAKKKTTAPGKSFGGKGRGPRKAITNNRFAQGRNKPSAKTQGATAKPRNAVSVFRGGPRSR